MDMSFAFMEMWVHREETRVAMSPNGESALLHGLRSRVIKRVDHAGFVGEGWCGRYCSQTLEAYASQKRNPL